MAIKGPSLSKEVFTSAVINKDPKALANAFGYSVARGADGLYLATVAEFPEMTHNHIDFIAAQNELKTQVIARLSAMDESQRPIPVGIANKMQIDKAKEVPKHIRKSFGREQNASE